MNIEQGPVLAHVRSKREPITGPCMLHLNVVLVCPSRRKSRHKGIVFIESCPGALRVLEWIPMVCRFLFGALSSLSDSPEPGAAAEWRGEWSGAHVAAGLGLDSGDQLNTPDRPVRVRPSRTVGCLVGAACPRLSPAAMAAVGAGLSLLAAPWPAVARVPLNRGPLSRRTPAMTVETPGLSPPLRRCYGDLPRY